MLNVSEAIKTALKASSRYIKYKVEVFFDGEDMPPTDITSDVMSFDTLDETVSGTLPFGEVTYNELSIVLDNLNNKYTITNENSPYVGKLLAGKKVRVTYLIETQDDVFEPLTGGIYYTDDWTVNSEANTAMLICYDYLGQVGYKPVQKFKVQTDLTIVEAFTLLMEAAAVDVAQYTIDAALKSSIPYFWCSGDDLRTCLGDLAMLTQTVVYTDKMGIIHIEPLVSSNVTDIELSDNTVLMSAKTEPSYSNVYSGVRVKYPAITSVQVEEIYKGEKISLQPGMNTLKDLLLSTAPVVQLTSVRISSKTSCKVLEFDCTDSTCTLVIENMGAVQEVTIVVEGLVVKTVDNTYYTEQESMTNNVLEISLPIASTEEYVKQYAQNILHLFTSYISNLEVTIIGYPLIEVHDKIYLDSAVADIHKSMQVVRVVHNFNNGLDTTVTIRHIEEVPL